MALAATPGILHVMSFIKKNYNSRRVNALAQAV